MLSLAYRSLSAHLITPATAGDVERIKQERLCYAYGVAVVMTRADRLLPYRYWHCCWAAVAWRRVYTAYFASLFMPACTALAPHLCPHRANTLNIPLPLSSTHTYTRHDVGYSMKNGAKTARADTGARESGRQKKKKKKKDFGPAV